MIKHARPSALADYADTTLIQPSDWNEDHMRGYDETFVIGIASFRLSGSTLVSPNFFGPSGIVGTAYRDSTGLYYVPVTLSAVKTLFNVDPAQNVQISGLLSLRPHGTLTAGYQWGIGQAGDSIELSLGDSSWNFVNPNVLVDVQIMIFGKVI